MLKYKSNKRPRRDACSNTKQSSKCMEIDNVDTQIIRTFLVFLY
jgi:hypothetical protein